MAALCASIGRTLARFPGTADWFTGSEAAAVGTLQRETPTLARPGYIAIGTTALTSISTLARSSISATTCTAVIAG